MVIAPGAGRNRPDPDVPADSSIRGALPVLDPR